MARTQLVYGERGYVVPWCWPINKSGFARQGVRRITQQRKTACFGVALAFFVCTPSTAFAQTPTPRDLTQISLEDLMNVEVVSVSKKEQKLSKVGASVFVITQDSIQRS